MGEGGLVVQGEVSEVEETSELALGGQRHGEVAGAERREAERRRDGARERQRRGYGR
jgi:hypothetical protein